MHVIAYYAIDNLPSYKPFSGKHAEQEAQRYIESLEKGSKEAGGSFILHGIERLADPITWIRTEKDLRIYKGILEYIAPDFPDRQPDIIVSDPVLIEGYAQLVLNMEPNDLHVGDKGYAENSGKLNFK